MASSSLSRCWRRTAQRERIAQRDRVMVMLGPSSKPNSRGHDGSRVGQHNILDCSSGCGSRCLGWQRSPRHKRKAGEILRLTVEQ